VRDEEKIREGDVTTTKGVWEKHPPLVQVESNVEEWPVFQLGRSKSDSVSVERVVDGEDGSSLHQRMEVSSPGKYRLPGRFDYDVYSAVLELLEVRGGMPDDGTIAFSLHELILLMDIEPSGKTYDEVKRSLRRIAATVLESDNAFWSRGQQRHISDTFRLWDVAFDAVTDRNGSGSRHQIEFGKLFQRSFEEQYLRGLDIEFFWSLQSPVAKRLYRLIDLKRAGSRSWATELFELQKHIPIGPYSYISKVKEKLSAAHDELLDRGFLSDISYPQTTEIAYTVSEPFSSRREELELAGTKEELIAIQLLTRSGLRGDVARDLVAKHGPSHCTRYANSLPQQQGLRNPAGWLRKAIENGFELSEPDSPRLFEESRGVDERRSSRVSSHSIGAAAGRGRARPAEDPQAREAWNRLLSELESSEGVLHAGWFQDFVAVSLKGDLLSVSAPGGDAASYVESRYGTTLRELWEGELEILGPDGV
jgi:hypothetical protein